MNWHLGPCATKSIYMLGKTIYWRTKWFTVRKWLAFQPFGMENPLNVKSLMASLKLPISGGESLNVSQATFHEYFIFWMSSQFNNSPGALDLMISACSIKLFTIKQVSSCHNENLILTYWIAIAHRFFKTRLKIQGKTARRESWREKTVTLVNCFIDMRQLSKIFDNESTRSSSAFMSTHQ